MRHSEVITTRLVNVLRILQILAIATLVGGCTSYHLDVSLDKQEGSARSGTAVSASEARVVDALPEREVVYVRPWAEHMSDLPWLPITSATARRFGGNACEIDASGTCDGTHCTFELRWLEPGYCVMLFEGRTDEGRIIRHCWSKAYYLDSISNVDENRRDLERCDDAI